MEIIEGSRSSSGGQEDACGVVNGRLKREECHFTFPFSPWKVIIGPSDWEDHSKNKEGAERYRVHNLPKCFSCPGVYEFGIRLPWSHSTSRLNKDRVIPVYLGEADKVRTRLQHYGRTGAHLEDGSLSGLFTDIFRKGFPIVFRWSPMRSKQEAEKTEADILGTYDYAWNKVNNGPRRHDDILKILDEITSKETKSLSISRKIRDLRHSKVSVQFENGSVMYNNQESNDVFSRILKFGRSNPRRITVTFGTSKGCADPCGVVLGHGCVCTRPPVEGRKRCAEHKGMKINDLKSKLVVEHKSISDNVGDYALPICGFTTENGYVCTSQVVPGRKRCEEHKGKKMEKRSEKLKVPSEKIVEVGLICGVKFEDGSICTRQAVIGRKRCEEHKGKKMEKRSEKLKVPLEETVEVGPICGVNFEDGSICTRQAVIGRKRCEEHKGKKTEKRSEKLKVPFEETVEVGPICGVNFEDGSICTRQAVIGRKRCEEHKGRRINNHFVRNSEFVPDTISCSSKNPKSSTISKKKIVEVGPTCGANLNDGTFCTRSPVEGRKRCWQHKGMRVYGEGSLGTSTSTYDDTRVYSNTCGSGLRYGSLSTWASTFDDTRAYSNMCGAGLRNGSICRRVPVRGRLRCEQHKGMRATFW